MLRKTMSFVRKSISMKILLIILMLVMPFNILMLSLSRASINATIEQSKLAIANLLDNCVINLENSMDVTEILLWNACYNDQTEIVYAKKGQNSEYELLTFYYDVKKEIDVVNGADCYFIYLSGVDEIYVWNGVDYHYSTLEGKKFVRKKMESGVENGWKLDYIDGNPILYFFSTNQRYGGWIDMQKIMDDLDESIFYEGAEVTFTVGKPIEEKRNHIQVSVDLNEQYYLNVDMHRSEIIGNLEVYHIFMLSMTILSLFLIPGLFVIIRKMMIKPIRMINQAHKNLRKGDLEYRIQENAKSIEFEYAFESFNEMADQIQYLKVDNYEKELARQRMELQNLQLQIRPHFLLNSFNLIYTLAERGENDSIQDTILYLADYFRYLFRENQNLEMFDKEQHLIEGYVQMLQVRYPNSVSIEYEYDEKVHWVRVPPLLLHNFVENIAKHVIQQGIMTHIRIQGRYEQGKVQFQIIDDGQGMTEEQLNELNESMRMTETDGTHIGYYNSMRRLKYFYGEEADIRIESVIGEGTCVTVSFPYDLEEYQ